MVKKLKKENIDDDITEKIKEALIKEPVDIVGKDEIEVPLITEPIIDFGADISDDWLLQAATIEPKKESLNNQFIFTGNIGISSSMLKPTFNFNEDQLLSEIYSYIESTYKGHYSGKYQATDIIIDAGHGIGFTLGNVIKYAKRYGKKEGRNRKDIMKVLHYAIMMLYTHDFDMKEQNETK